MNWSKYTKLVIGLIIVLIAVWDVFVIVKGGTEASISNRLIVWSYDYPMFTFSMGLVFGHLFWRMKTTPELKKIEEDIKERNK